MSKTRILLIEDDPVDRMAFERFAASEAFPYNYAMARSLAEARELLKSKGFDCVIADYLLGDGTAFDILALDLEIPVIITTGAGSEQVAVQAMKAGAHDYLIKDQERNYLKVLPVTVEGALKQKRAEERIKLQSERESGELLLLGSDRGMAEVFRLIELAASSTSPVLITGETGTGKNLVAKAIHFKGSARTEPFLAINCLSLPENLIEAELFGCEKGAFTGAITGRKGLFELADGGTILLDEIGEMPLHLQGKLLSVIEDKKVRRLGGEIEKPFKVRITASTNIDIEKALGNSFRKDLYYRLSIMRIHLPPLRERRGDIPVLCRGLLKELAGGKEVSLSDGEMKKLMAYDWPGNVRELKNILERAVILQKGCEFRPSELLGKTNGREIGAQDSGLPSFSAAEEIMPLEELKKKYIHLTLRKLSGNRLKTAAALGISLNTIKRSIKDMEA